MPCGHSSLVSRRRFDSARSSSCSTSFQSMNHQPAARLCGLSAFYAAVCTNQSSSCRSTNVLESRLARLLLDSASKNSGKCLAADRTLEGSHVRSVQRAKFLRNVLRCTIQNQEPGYQLSVPRACVHVRVNRVDRVQESVLRDPVRRRVGHELARKQSSMRAHSVGLHLTNNLSTCHLSCLQQV